MSQNQTRLRWWKSALIKKAMAVVIVLVMLVAGVGFGLDGLEQGDVRLGGVNIVQAQTMPIPEQAKVTQILEERQVIVDTLPYYTQKLEIERQSNGQKSQVEVGSEFQPLTAAQRLKAGTKVLVAAQPQSDGSTRDVITDVYRFPILLWLVGGFLVLVVLVARLQGVMSMIGLVISLGVLVGWVVPQIMAGHNPVLVSLSGAAAIALVTVYLSHGWNWHSHLALFSMLSTLIAVALLAAGAIQLAQLVGLGSEEAAFLQFGPNQSVNLQGLLLGGIVLGALGILDDICIAQISVVWQLKEVNQKLGFEELYQRGLAVGKDHVASLVNTLVLAYAGANLPLFILFVTNKQMPWWITVNSEIIAEEVVRTTVGSIGLVLAVPIATLLAAVWVSGLGVRGLVGRKSE